MKRPFSLKEFALVGTVVAILIGVIDAVTNELDITKYVWDFVYYIAMAKEGFDAKLVSPVAYRYMTPFLAGGLHRIFDVSVPEAFKTLAYIGLWMQLVGSYAFVRYYLHTRKGAVAAMLFVAFSAINVKFLLFDPYRPDLFGYALVLLATWLAFTRRIVWLLVVSAIGVQFREFVIVPLAAYTATLLFSGAWSELKRYGPWIAATLFVAVVLPRLLIDVTHNYQFIQRIEHLWLIPMDRWRDFNWLYTIFIYFLPTLALFTPARWRAWYADTPVRERLFFLFYTLLVALLSLYGGTDLGRFSTYLFLTQIVLAGHFARNASRAELLFVIAAVGWFNKIYGPIPVWDFNLYLNWYCGYSNIVTDETFRRIYIAVGIIAATILLRLVERRLWGERV